MKLPQFHAAAGQALSLSLGEVSGHELCMLSKGTLASLFSPGYTHEWASLGVGGIIGWAVGQLEAVCHPLAASCLAPSPSSTRETPAPPHPTFCPCSLLPISP